MFFDLVSKYREDPDLIFSIKQINIIMHILTTKYLGEYAFYFQLLFTV